MANIAISANILQFDLFNLPPVEKEVWVDIKGFEGRYRVSSFGQVKSVERFVNADTGLRLIPEKILKQKPSFNANAGYVCVVVRNTNKHSVTIPIHRSVAEHFIPNPNHKSQVNHKDGNKLNNHVSNLEWATSSENTIHSYKNKLQVSIIGEDHKLSKLTTMQAIEIFDKLDNGIHPKDIALEYGVAYTTIKSMHNGYTWHHLKRRTPHYTVRRFPKSLS